MTQRRADQIIESIHEAYDAIAAGFSETRARVWSEHVPVSKLIHKGQHVLDIGCGNGRFLQILPSSGITYTGIDHSVKLLEKAQANAKNFPGIESNFEKGTILHLPCRDKSFDVVLCIAVLHHVPSQAYRKQAVSEVFRVLTTGGRVIMSNWYLLSFWRHFIPQIRNRVQHPRRYTECTMRDFFIPWHRNRDHAVFYRYYYAFRRKELIQLLVDAGFVIQESHISQTESNWKGGRRKRNFVIVAKKEP